MGIEVAINAVISVKDSSAVSISDIIDSSNGIVLIKETVASGDDVTLSTESGSKDNLDLFSITSSMYNDGSVVAKKITYEYGPDVGNLEDPLDLVRAQVLIGNNMVKLLKSDPKTIKFTNTTDEKIDIQILMVRRATV